MGSIGPMFPRHFYRSTPLKMRGNRGFFHRNCLALRLHRATAMKLGLRTRSINGDVRCERAENFGRAENFPPCRFTGTHRGVPAHSAQMVGTPMIESCVVVM